MLRSINSLDRQLKKFSHIEEGKKKIDIFKKCLVLNQDF